MMRVNINPGDKVSFINEPVQGVVTSIKANGLVGVTIENDFEIDVRAEELVVLEKSATAAPAAAVVKPVENRFVPKAGKGIYWLISENDSGFVVSLLNNTENPVLFAAYRSGITSNELMQSGSCGSGEVKDISHIKGKERNRRGKFTISVLLLRHMPATIPLPYHHIFDFEQWNAIDPDAISHLSKNWLIRIENSQEKPVQAAALPNKMPAEVQSISRPDKEIDLHAESLGLHGLDGDAILKMQMETFQKNLELGIAWQMDSMIFIHGVGSGVLKNLIYLALKGKKDVTWYGEANHSTYGYGATEVRFVKNRV
jgi:hypothetical protein